jgi:uncharacterized protein involved in propanediol utilization
MSSLTYFQQNEFTVKEFCEDGPPLAIFRNFRGGKKKKKKKGDVDSYRKKAAENGALAHCSGFHRQTSTVGVN